MVTAVSRWSSFHYRVWSTELIDQSYLPQPDQLNVLLVFWLLFLRQHKGPLVKRDRVRYGAFPLEITPTVGVGRSSQTPEARFHCLFLFR